MARPNDHIMRQRQLASLCDKADRAERALTQAEAILANPETDPITRQVTQARIHDFRRNAEETHQAYMEVKHEVQ